MREVRAQARSERLRLAFAGLLLAATAAGCAATAEQSRPAPVSDTGTPVMTPAATKLAPVTDAAASPTEVPEPASVPTSASAARQEPAKNTSTPEPAEAPPADPAVTAAPAGPVEFEVQEYDVPARSHPHDVAPAADGGIWYTAQAGGALGWLDPATGKTEHIPLGRGSAPHGVITGPDDAAWVTDGGLNAMVRVDPVTREVKRYDLPPDRPSTNLNTAVFDAAGKLWFTGQSGIFGVLDPATGEMRVFDAPRGRGPYGITGTADGKVYYASLAGSYLGEIYQTTGEVKVLEPPTAGQGARRAWADSTGRVWVSAWNTGQLARYDPATGEWAEWKLPGDNPKAYAVYVDWQDKVWLSDFGNNSLVRFDPETEQWHNIPLPSPSASVRQIHGREGEIWGAESSADKLVVVRVK